MGLKLENIKLGFNSIFVVQFEDGKIDLENNISKELQEKVILSVEKLIWSKEYEDLVKNSEEKRLKFAKDFLIKEGLIE